MTTKQYSAIAALIVMASVMLTVLLTVVEQVIHHSKLVEVWLR